MSSVPAFDSHFHDLVPPPPVPKLLEMQLHTLVPASAP